MTRVAEHCKKIFTKNINKQAKTLKSQLLFSILFAAISNRQNDVLLQIK